MKNISVIIPSYNHAHYIEAAIDSVLSQDIDDLELIIIDDGSKDDSVEVISNYQDKRIQLLCQENQGADAAINRGLQNANGQYLTILNSDDIYLPNRLHILTEQLTSEQKHIATSWIEVIGSEGEHIGIKEGWKNMLPWDIGAATNEADPLLQLLLSNYVSTTSNIVFTRKLYEQIGGMKKFRFVHDWDFLLRSCAEFDLHIQTEPLLQYRVHPTNTISSNRKWMMFEICLILAANLPTFLNKRLSISQLGTVLKHMNFQGNDKLVWLLMAYLNGNEMSLDSLLDTPDLIETFTAMVEIDS